MFRYMGVKDSAAVRHYYRDSIEQGTSVMAIDTANNNKIVGVRAHRVTTKSEQKDIRDEVPRDDPAAPYTDLVGLFQQRYNPWTKLDVDKFLYLKFLCVHRDYRGRNISVKMMDMTFDFMRREKIPVVYVFASSAYSQGVFEKTQFEKVDYMAYEDYKVDGEVVFKVGPVHKGCATYVKWIDI